MAAPRPHTHASTSAPNGRAEATGLSTGGKRPLNGREVAPRQEVAASFAELGLPPGLVTALAAAGITTPFPIQTATLPDALAGRDVLGRGRTGSGKTYAFVLPMLARLAASSSPRRPNRPRALILAPTRELASQIDAAIAPLAKPLGLRTLTIFGGVGAQPQISGLRAGVDIVVACPGRLADHVQTGHANLDSVEITVLDEADHMADLGFLPVVRRLLDKTPRNGQRLLFSATLDAGVDVLVKRFLNNPVTHSVDSAKSPVTAMSHHVLHVAGDSRVPVLVDLASAPGRTLVFTRTKHGAKSLARKLTAAGVPALELHGNLSQNARTRNLTAFSDGSTHTLVATDIAARGIHVDDVSLVVHADPPVEHKAYLHRSGRTARAGAQGTVVTLMTDAQVSDVRDLARKAGIKPTITRLAAGHPLLSEIAPGDRELVYTSPAARVPGDERNRDRSDRRRSAKGQGTGRAKGQGAGRRPSTEQAKRADGRGSDISSRRTSGQLASRGRAGSAASGASSAAAFSTGARPSQRRRGR